MGKTPLIAIVGMAGVFPGAEDVERFWRNIIGKADPRNRYPRIAGLSARTGW
jgi:acyl transferase domain-containing protein